MTDSYVQTQGVGWDVLTGAKLGASGVTAGTYGDATHVGQVTVSAQGIVTAASSVAITGGGGGGGILAFVTQTTTVSTAGTTYGTGAAVFGSSPSFTADGSSSYLVTVRALGQTNSGVNNNGMWLTLDGAQSVFMMWAQVNAANQTMPLSAVGVVTPAAGVHTVNAVLFVSAGTGKLFATPEFGGSPVIVLTVETL